jgi:hypothetical protein
LDEGLDRHMGSNLHGVTFGTNESRNVCGDTRLSEDKQRQ